MGTEIGIRGHIVAQAGGGNLKQMNESPHTHCHFHICTLERERASQKEEVQP